MLTQLFKLYHTQLVALSRPQEQQRTDLPSSSHAPLKGANQKAMCLGGIPAFSASKAAQKKLAL